MQSTPEPLCFDARPLLAKGIEPFPYILEYKRRLLPGQVFQLLAPFQPVPLYSVFEAEGYTVEVNQPEPDCWEIRFTPSGSATPGRGLEIDFSGTQDVDETQLADTLRSLGRDSTLKVLTQERPDALLATVDSEAFEWECEPTESGRWMTTFWRIVAD